MGEASGCKIDDSNPAKERRSKEEEKKRMKEEKKKKKKKMRGIESMEKHSTWFSFLLGFFFIFVAIFWTLNTFYSKD